MVLQKSFDVCFLGVFVDLTVQERIYFFCCSFITQSFNLIYVISIEDICICVHKKKGKIVNSLLNALN